MASPAANIKKNLIAWLRFPDGSASLRRVLLPNGIKALLLDVRDESTMSALEAGALSLGFGRLSNSNRFRIMLEDGRIPFSMPQAREALGGEIFTLTRDDLVSTKWTIDVSGARVSRNTNQPPVIDQVIGLNPDGVQVARDKEGTRFLRFVDEEGKAQFQREAPEDRANRFLRIRDNSDLGGIAAGLIAMARKGTLHRGDFDRVMASAVETAPQELSDIGSISRKVKNLMLTRISDIGLENNAGRDRFIAALNLANATSFLLSRSDDLQGGLSPSPALAVFLRRHFRSANAIDFRGNNDMQAILPRNQRKDASSQFHDLSRITPDVMPAYLQNVLQRREAEGQSVFLVPGRSDSDISERIRTEIGLSHAFDAVAEISATVSDGVQDAEAWTFFFVGEARPEKLDALPEAARRTFRVITSEDLMGLEREISRARNRIRDFHQGIEEQEGPGEDSRVENQRQKPYQPLSRISEPFTMIPLALEGATNHALERLRRDMADIGGVDAAVAAAVGFDQETLKEVLTAEQVDAIALRMAAGTRNRAFLVADQTGIGKGRMLAAIARAHLRADPENKVLYLTESAPINVPDVCRDLNDVQAWNDASPLFLTSGSVYERERVDPMTGEMTRETISSPPPRQRKAIFESGSWPDDHNMIITTYSQFNSREGDVRSFWVENAIDGKTLIVLDEAHNAINPRSNTGRNIRNAIDIVGPQNVLYGTATPYRNPEGMDLYKALLPQAEGGRFEEILNNIKDGGEVAQEAFATMLAEDGVFIRRDHDLSNIEFRIALPDDERILRYQEIMDRFSPVVELMLNVSLEIGDHIDRRATRDYQNALRRGMSLEQARAQSNALNQYSLAIGGPLANLSRITMNAIKVDQVVDEALEEMREGRKPLITFHSTNAALLNDIWREMNAQNPGQAAPEIGSLTLRDQVKRIHDRIYRIRIDGEIQDARDVYPDIQRTADLVEEAIANLPDDLPVSPIDALIERFEAQGVSVGEISGRSLCYRDGQIRRRQGRNRKETIDAFNAGALDVMIYNGAGATGGSFHASEKFADQRARTMIELETPIDIIKYVQSMGRGNRYGQVANPRVKSVMTGLTPEMRIMQQRNRKLRLLGASVDGNRSHPLLLDDVPDLLNRVGDEATRNVLMSMPALTRRMGFPEFAEDNDRDAAQGPREVVDIGSGTVQSGIQSLSNKILARSLMLSAKEQDELVERIRMEFDVLIEELESRNANPLRPKMLDGQVEFRATSLFIGEERPDDDFEASAFSAPLYISTGIHHFNEEAWNGERLLAEVENCQTLHGIQGFAPWAERIRQNIPTLLRPYLPEGTSMEDALANPEIGGSRFLFRHKRLTDLTWMLENIQPGVALRYPCEIDPDAQFSRVVVGLKPPRERSYEDLPSAYKVQLIMPGMARPETVSLSRLASLDIERLRFRPALADGVNQRFMDFFSREALLKRRIPVQILSGNILQAITEAARHDLGSISLYRDMNSNIHRGIVVASQKIDLNKLPVQIPSSRIAVEALRRFMAKEDNIEAGVFRIWGSMEPGKPAGDRKAADIIMTLSRHALTIDMIPPRKTSYDFYAERPGLHDLLFNKPLPERSQIPSRVVRIPGRKHKNIVTIKLNDEDQASRALEIMRRLYDVPLMADAPLRELVNDITTQMERLTHDIEEEDRLRASDENDAHEMETMSP